MFGLFKKKVEHPLVFHRTQIDGLENGILIVHEDIGCIYLKYQNIDVVRSYKHNNEIVIAANNFRHTMKFPSQEEMDRVFKELINYLEGRDIAVIPENTNEKKLTNEV